MCFGFDKIERHFTKYAAMRIKTITCHNVYNYGASLQAYALMSYLESLGHDVKIIDYMPQYIRKNLSLWAIGPRWNKNFLIRFAFYCYVVPIRLLQYKSRKKFDEFSDRYFNLTKRYNSFEELVANPPESDICFCGSDQIWNPEIQNGLDPAFYLDFVPSCVIRASYAASFSVSSIKDEYKSFIKALLEKMNFISVREKTGIRIVQSLMVSKDAVNVVDPVFLLDSSQWMSMTYIPNHTDYILVYDQENNASIQAIAKSIARNTGKKIIAFKDLYPRNYANIKVKYSGPIDFISLIAAADVIITNSFHCMAFSIIMNKNFFVVPRTHQKVNSRMNDFLTYLNIADRIVKDKEEMENCKKIDYAYVNTAIAKLRKDSEFYIDLCLKAASKCKS